MCVCKYECTCTYTYIVYAYMYGCISMHACVHVCMSEFDDKLLANAGTKAERKR